MSNTDCTILECPDCQSHRAGIIASTPPQAKCADCGKIYDIATLPPPNTTKTKRTASPGKRHRRDNGPAELEVQPVARPTSEQLGTLHVHTEQIIGGGPKALLLAHRRGSKLAHLYGEEFTAEWRLKTKWLTDLESSDTVPSLISSDASVASLLPVRHMRDGTVRRYNHRLRNRARVRYAMKWRPMFLAVVALTYSLHIGAQAAGIAVTTMMEHRKADPDFDAQVIAAQAHCIELLHSVAMRRVIEGDCEPIFWQGIEVGHVRKFDGRLQLEMLRAHMPKVFKTPGTHNAIVAGDGNQVLICDRETVNKIVAMRQEALREEAEKYAQAIEVSSTP
jgi:hypothetical protein